YPSTTHVRPLAECAISPVSSEMTKYVPSQIIETKFSEGLPMPFVMQSCHVHVTPALVEVPIAPVEPTVQYVPAPFEATPFKFAVVPLVCVVLAANAAVSVVIVPESPTAQNLFSV